MRSRSSSASRLAAFALKGSKAMLCLIRLLLRLELRRLSRRTVGPFDPDLSARIDSVLAALEALGGRA